MELLLTVQFNASTQPETTVPSSHDESEQEAQQKPLKTAKRKKNRKRKNKNKTTEKSELLDDDALLEAAQKSHAIVSTSQTSTSTAPSTFLSINRKSLDFRAELSRKFGSSANENRRRNPLPFGQLIRPSPHWPNFERCGLGMKQNDDGSFAITHDRDYVKQQKAFYVIRNALDANALTVNPFHLKAFITPFDTQFFMCLSFLLSSRRFCPKFRIMLIPSFPSVII